MRKSARSKGAKARNRGTGYVLERLEDRLQLSVAMELADVTKQDLFVDLYAGTDPGYEDIIDTARDKATAIALNPVDSGFAALIEAHRQWGDPQIDLYSVSDSITRVPIRSTPVPGVTTYSDGAFYDPVYYEMATRSQPTVAYDAGGTIHFAYIAWPYNQQYYNPLVVGIGSSFYIADDYAAEPTFAKGSNGDIITYLYDGAGDARHAGPGLCIMQGGSLVQLTLDSNDPYSQTLHASAAVGVNGEVYVAYTVVKEVRTDQGATMQSVLYVTMDPDGLGGPASFTPAQEIYYYPDNVVAPEQPVIDVDRSDSPLRGTAYIAFSTGNYDGVGDVGSKIEVVAHDPDATGWGVPVDVDPDPVGLAYGRYRPWMDVDELTGAVHVVFQGQGADGDGVHGAISTNGGGTFYTGMWSSGLSAMMADRIGVDAVNGTARPIWSEAWAADEHERDECVTTATGTWRLRIDGQQDSDLDIRTEPDPEGGDWLVVTVGQDEIYRGLLDASKNITIDGHGSHLVISTGAGSDAVTVDGSTIQFAGVTITYTNVADITINTDGGDDILTQVGQPSAPLVFNGGTDADTLNVQAGTFTFDSDALVGTSSLAINVSGSGSVVFNASQHIRALNIQGGGATLSAGGSKVLVTQSLNMATSGGSYLGYLDLTDNDMIIKSDAANVLSVLDSTTAMIASGRNANPTRWTGSGVRSSTAASAPGGLTGLGITRNLNNGTPIFTTFDGELVDQYSVIVKYTWNGDADLNGMIDGSDYFLIDKGFLSRNLTPPLTGWHWGDFDYNGIIDGSDYFLIDRASMVQDGTLL